MPEKKSSQALKTNINESILEDEDEDADNTLDAPFFGEQP